MSVVIVVIMLFLGKGALSKLVQKYMALNRMIPPEIISLVSLLVSDVMWPISMLVGFYFVQNIAIDFIAIPFLLASKSVLDDAKGKTADDDTPRAKARGFFRRN